MTVIVTVSEAACLTVSEKKAETMMLLTTHQAPQNEPLVVNAADQRYTQTKQFICLGNRVENRLGNRRKVQIRLLLYLKCGRRLFYKQLSALLNLKVRMLKTEVLKTLLIIYGCITWTLGHERYAKLRAAPRYLLLRAVCRKHYSAKT